MKVVILCGGLGTRLREETEYRPKPLVPIGNKPILWHIMKIYSSYGFNEFILCLGYKGEMIKEYFLNYVQLAHNFTLKLRSKNEKIVHRSKTPIEDWTITFVDTGQTTQTGGRLAKIQEYLGKDKSFFLTYGDGVAQIDLGALLKFHKRHKRLGTITGVRPPSRFGEIELSGQQVKAFSEKPLISHGFVSGGFFVLNREIFDYVRPDEGCVFEKEPLENLVNDGQLMMYPLTTFWHCMDTARDNALLNEMWTNNQAPWKVWQGE